MRSVDVVLKRVREGALIVLLLALTAVALRTYFVLLPKAASEIDEAHRASTEGALTLMDTRKITDAELKALPATQARVNTALDNVVTVTSTANTVLLSVRGAVDGIDSSQKQITDQTVATLKTAQDGVAAVKPMLEASQKAIEGLQPVEQQTTTTIAEIHTAAVGLTTAATDPAIHKTFQNVADATGDIKDKIHSTLHPKWPGVVFNWTERIGVDIGRVFAP